MGAQDDVNHILANEIREAERKLNMFGDRIERRIERLSNDMNTLRIMMALYIFMLLASQPLVADALGQLVNIALALIFKR